MANVFGLSQGTNDMGQYADVTIPGCGTLDMDNGPVIHIEFQDGKPILYVWGDIASLDFTHKIDLSDALETNRNQEE